MSQEQKTKRYISMRIKHELYKFEHDKPFLFKIGLYVPGFKFDYKKMYDEVDFVLELPTILEASKYEYGYTFTFKVLGFGFDIWLGNL